MEGPSYADRCDIDVKILLARLSCLEVGRVSGVETTVGLGLVSMEVTSLHTVCVHLVLTERDYP